MLIVAIITVLSILLQLSTIAAVVWTYKRNRLTFATVHAGVRQSHDDLFSLVDSVSEQIKAKPKVSVEDYVELVNSYLDACITLLQAGLLESGNALERDSQAVVET